MTPRPSISLAATQPATSPRARRHTSACCQAGRPDRRSGRWRARRRGRRCSTEPGRQPAPPGEARRGRASRLGQQQRREPEVVGGRRKDGGGPSSTVTFPASSTSTLNGCMSPWHSTTGPFRRRGAPQANRPRRRNRHDRPPRRSPGGGEHRPQRPRVDTGRVELDGYSCRIQRMHFSERRNQRDGQGGAPGMAAASAQPRRRGGRERAGPRRGPSPCTTGHRSPLRALAACIVGVG
jgi:hypothetical protein